MPGELSELVVAITTDNSGLAKGLSEASSQVAQTAKEMTVALTAVTATMAIGIKGALDYGSEIYRMSQITGLSAESLSRLKYAADQSDVSFEGLVRSLEMLTKNVDVANSGNIKMTENFARMGLSISDLRGKNPQELLEIMAQKFQALGGGAQATALVMETFGRNASTLIPMLRLSSTELQELYNKSDALGNTLSNKEAKALHTFNDNLKDFQVSLRGIWIEMANEVMPAVSNFLKALEDSHILKDMAEGFKESLEVINELPAAIKIAAAAMVLLGTTVGRTVGLILLLPDIAKGWTLIGMEIKRAALELNLFFDQFTKFLPGTQKDMEKVKQQIADIDKVESATANKPSILTTMMEDLKKLSTEVNQFNANPKNKPDITPVIDQNKVNVQLNSLVSGFKVGLADIKARVDELSTITSNFIITFHQGVSDAISAGILGTETWAQAFQDLGAQMLKAIVDFFVQWVVYQVMARGLAMIAMASSIAMAATIGAAWAPAAAMASLATMGGNAAPASASLTSTTALAQLLAIPKAEIGGIVDRPTILLAGEHNKKEAIIPLEDGKNYMGNKITIYMSDIKIAKDIDINTVAQKLAHDMNQKLKRVS